MDITTAKQQFIELTKQKQSVEKEIKELKTFILEYYKDDVMNRKQPESLVEIQIQYGSPIQDNKISRVEILNRLNENGLNVSDIGDETIKLSHVKCRKLFDEYDFLKTFFKEGYVTLKIN